MIKANRTGTQVITGLVKLVYVHIFEPYSPEGIEGYEPRYSTTVLIPKCDAETLNAIHRAIDEAIAQVARNLKIVKMPFRDGDRERPGDPLYKGCYFLTATSKNKPGVVDSNVNSIVEPIEVKNGCYARVSLNLYDYDLYSNKGVAAGLGNIQLIGGADHGKL